MTENTIEASTDPLKPRSGFKRDLLAAIITFVVVFTLGWKYIPGPPSATVTKSAFTKNIEKPSTTSIPATVQTTNAGEEKPTPAEAPPVIESEAISAPATASESIHEVEKIEPLPPTPTVSLSKQITIMALLVGFNDIEHRAREGKPFDQPLDELKLIAVDTQLQPIIQDLNHYAHDGVITAADLLQKFDDAAARSYRSRFSVEQNAGAWEHIKSNLAKLVVIRRTDAKDGEPDALLTQAQQALAAGNLSRSITMIEQLPTDQQKPFQAWLSHAKARADMEGLLDKIRQGLLEMARTSKS